MTDRTQQEIDLAAAFDAFTYLDGYLVGLEGWKLCDIMTKISNEYELLIPEDKEYFDVIREAINRNPEIAGYELLSISAQRPEALNSNGDTILWACTFKSTGNDYYVAYRGTGDGQWVDNGEGMYKPSTVIQEAAAEYFNAVVERWDLKENDNIIITGHSKGGNLAQYVTLASKYANLIDFCYSFDGQGFSQKAIEAFKNQLGDQYLTQIDKMYSINGENDYVHDLGIPVIPSDRTFFVPTPEGTSIGGMHGLQHMIVNGEIILDLENPLQQGPMGAFAKKLSMEMMQLNDEDLEDCALSVMSLIEKLKNGEEDYQEGIGNEKFADFEEFCGFISVGIPLILKTAVTTEEGRAAVGYIAMDNISGLAATENGCKMIIAFTAVGLLCGSAVVMLGKSIIIGGSAIWMGATLVDGIFDLFDSTFELSDLKSVAIVAKIIAIAARVLSANPHAVVAVLTVVAVIALVTYVVQHWDEIKAFIKSTGAFFVGLATALYAWAENLVESAVNLIKNAVGKALAFYQNIKQAIIDFGSRLISAATGFFKGLSQAFFGFFDNIAKWASGLFGSSSAVLREANQITVMIYQIEEIQRYIGNLRASCLDAEKKLDNTNGLVHRVYNYYDESYVRNCCRDIQNDLKIAQKYLSMAEKELDRKYRALATAVDAYRRSDQNAVQDIRKVAINFT